MNIFSIPCSYFSISVSHFSSGVGTDELYLSMQSLQYEGVEVQWKKLTSRYEHLLYELKHGKDIEVKIEIF